MPWITDEIILSSASSAEIPPLKARILFILPSLSAGGAERNTLTLARGLSQDFDVHIAVIRAKGRLLQEVPTDVTMHDLRGRLRFLFWFPLFTRATKPRVIVSSFTDVSILVLMTRFLQFASTKIVVRESSLPLARFRKKKFRRFLEWLYKSAYRKADRIVALTQRAADVMCREAGLPRERVDVIPNAIDGKSCSDTPVVTEGKGHHDKFRLITIGRLEHVKGYDVLLECLKTVVPKFPTLQLTIYGEGSQRENLESDIDRLGLRHHASLAGYTSDTTGVFQNADLFVLCSRFEGMSNAMLEALGCGVPVLAINNSDVSTEDVIVDGVNGFLVTELSVPVLARGLIRAMDEIHRMDRNRISHDAHQRFSREAYLERYRSLLQKVIGER